MLTALGATEIYWQAARGWDGEGSCASMRSREEPKFGRNLSCVRDPGLSGRTLSSRTQEAPSPASQWGGPGVSLSLPGLAWPGMTGREETGAPCTEPRGHSPQGLEEAGSLEGPRIVQKRGRKEVPPPSLASPGPPHPASSQSQAQ